MQSLKDEHATGFEPDEKWFRAFIGKLILFRTTQDIVKRQKFAAYQAIISAYTVACLAQRYEQVFDLELVWSRQAISSQLESVIRAVGCRDRQDTQADGRCADAERVGEKAGMLGHPEGNHARRPSCPPARTGISRKAREFGCCGILLRLATRFEIRV